MDNLTSFLPTQIAVMCADARSIPLKPNFVDLIVTSPPYWRKRDYGIKEQIGQENSLEEYILSLRMALKEWRRVLRPTGSVFLNLGDTYINGSLAGIPAMIETVARGEKWRIRNRIIWAKENGAPEAASNRLANRHEYILHLTRSEKYFYDIVGYTERFGKWGNPGDVWHVKTSHNKSPHLAPFPEEIVERAILLACPQQVCTQCGKALTRQTKRLKKLNPNRPQARRALELMEEKGLTDEHIEAIQSTGISDAGKALQFQTGAGRNSARVKELAEEAKEALGGYFREFTFALPETVGWNGCDCNQPMKPGVVLDPFMGTGTTLKVARRLGRSAYGSDLTIPDEFRNC